MIKYDELEKLVGSSKITQETLRKRGNPYARRRPRNLSPLVHVQSGKLSSALMKSRKGIVWKDKPKYVDYVLKGTSRMIPREFILAALKNAESKLKEIWK